MGNIGKILLLLRDSNSSWDVLIFVQHWPKSVCDKWLEQRSDNTCGPFPSGTWTIHGIWPTKIGTRGPNDCDSSRPFSLQEISSLERQLLQDWAPIQNHRQQTYFWNHEWNKHGTCAEPVLTNQYQYFKQAIDWLHQYNMLSVLRSAGITPGGSYRAADIINGVQSVLNKRPQVTCYVNNKYKTVLLEIRICFDKSMQLVDCEAYCNCRNDDVHYPQG